MLHCCVCKTTKETQTHLCGIVGIAHRRIDHEFGRFHDSSRPNLFVPVETSAEKHLSTEVTSTAKTTSTNKYCI